MANKIKNVAPETNEFLNKVEEIRARFDNVRKQVLELEDESKRLQGEYRAIIELGLKMGYLTEEAPTGEVKVAGEEEIEGPVCDEGLVCGYDGDCADCK